MIDHRHVIFVLAVVKVAKRDVTAVRSLKARTSRFLIILSVRVFFYSTKYILFCIFKWDIFDFDSTVKLLLSDLFDLALTFPHKSSAVFAVYKQL